MQSADVFPKAGKHSVSWYRRNENAFAFEETIRVQSLEPIRDSLEDPLLHRTLGGWVTGAGFESMDDRTLATPPLDTGIPTVSPCHLLNDPHYRVNPLLQGRRIKTGG
jgi:hypothetical protein